MHLQVDFACVPRYVVVVGRVLDSFAGAHLIPSLAPFGGSFIPAFREVLKVRDDQIAMTSMWLKNELHFGLEKIPDTLGKVTGCWVKLELVHVGSPNWKTGTLPHGNGFPLGLRK
ncbi:hypothetical protein P245_20150 [Comamonas thiooxydans]|uniref:Uncharacterized protein n=1 Tax=Comamonas thiooxydans TaxID=363952 RepID=A0A0E3BA64_9BURK|nr:hypothetical protein P245_20150 [Comamonas thiooxydans]